MATRCSGQKYGTLGWIALPNHLCISARVPLISPIIDLMFFGSLLLWVLAQFRVRGCLKLWTTSDVEKIGPLLPGLFAHRHTHVHGGLRLGAQGRLDAAVPRLVAALLLRQLMYVVLFDP